MMTLLRLHIEYLLRSHDCVIIPYLGAIIATYTSARFDRESGAFLPPTRTFSFNPAIINDDGMLASSIARRNKISFEEARSIAADASSEMRNVLETEGTLQLPRIGNLTYADGRISFMPSQQDAPGRCPITLTPLEAETKPAEPTVADEEKKYYHLRIRKSIANAAAVLIVALAVGIAFLLPTDAVTAANEPQMQTAAVVPMPAPKTVVEEVATPAVEEKTEEIGPQHHLIVATFRSMKEAENYVASKKGKNFSLTIIPSSTLHRVSAQSSQSVEQLRETMRQEAFQTDFPQAWIYTK